MQTKKAYRYVAALLALVLLLAAANLLFGSVDIPTRSVLNILCGSEAEKESWKIGRAHV